MIKIHIADNVMQLDFWKAAWRRDSELYRILSKQVVKSNKCLPFTTPWSEEDSTRGLMVLCCIPFMNVVVTFPCCLLQIISTPLLEPWLVFSYRLYSLLWTVASFRNMNTTTAQTADEVHRFKQSQPMTTPLALVSSDTQCQRSSRVICRTTWTLQRRWGFAVANCVLTCGGKWLKTEQDSKLLTNFPFFFSARISFIILICEIFSCRSLLQMMCCKNVSVSIK